MLQVLRGGGAAGRRRQEPARAVDARRRVPSGRERDRRRRRAGAGAGEELWPADRRVPAVRVLRAAVDRVRARLRRPVLRHRLL